MATIEAVSPHGVQSAHHGPIFHFPDIQSTDQPPSPDGTVSADSDTDERYSFTPRQLPRGPRAWQRQPSQPFAPRNDAQKIWKRAPLKNITSEINTRWKRGVDEDDGVVRPAKRLKLTQGHADGKENDEVDILPSSLPPSSDSESPPSITKHTSLQDSEPQEQETLPDSGTLETEGDPEAVETEEAAHEAEPSPSHDGVADPIAADSNTDESGTLPPGYEQISTLYNSTESAESEPGPEMCFDITPTIASGSDASLDASPGTPTDGQIVAELDPSGDLDSQISELIHSESASASDAYVSAVEEASVSPTGQSVTKAQQNNDSSASLTAPQAFRPSVQPEEDDTAFLQNFLQRAKQARETKPSLQLYRPVGDQVKRHLIEQHNQASAAAPQANERKRPLSPEPEDLSHIDSPEEATVTTSVFIPSVEEVTEKVLSPSRRSNRLSANTKLPRPQRPIALPNNISLRRLNGTEFISMAKQRSEAQGAAMTTRNNTRKNKGSALSVQQKLEQIKLGFAGAGDQAGMAAVDESERAKKLKVRKKTGVEYDHIVWAHKIARYQKDGEEHTLTLDGMWETENGSQASKVEQDDDDSDSHQPAEDIETKGDSESMRGSLKKPARPSATTSKKTTRASSSSSKPKSKLKAPADKYDTVEASNTSSRKSDTTKRKRAETTGTVNGTPAPKRGLDMMLESARDNEGVTTALGLAGRETNVESKGHEATGAETRGSKRLKAKQSAAGK